MLEERIKDGYSILIFPEGTRSVDCSIQRFHQGAFYLADKLNLDIIPIVLHGVGHVMPKNELYVRPGKVNVEIGRRITAKELRCMGNSSVQRASAIRNLYSNLYRKAINKYETVEYYEQLVYHNYIYKGVEIQRECRKNLKSKMSRADSLASEISSNSYVLLENCGQGEIALLLALARRDVRFVANDKDPLKMEIARNCMAVPDNLIYSQQIVTEDFDIIIDLKEI